jgi:hypothetical protein
MTLTRMFLRAVLIASGCTSIWAQTAPLTPLPVVPDPVAPQPFQFNGSQYKGLLPGWPVILKPQGSLVIANRIVPGNRPCAVARVMKPNSGIDPQMIPRQPGPAPIPTEAHSRDIAEQNVPAPSCGDVAAQQATIRMVLPRPVPPDQPPAR